MANLKFDDIDDWTPSSISIVDEPSHPLCHFEVYEDDEDYVKKSIEINEGEMMVEQNPQNEEPMVQAPVSFFERLLGRTVGKAVEDEIPPKPPEKEEKADSNLEARIAKLEEKLAQLEKELKPKETEEEKETVPGAVTKSEGEAEGEASEAESEETTTSEEDEIVDEEEVVVKSRSIDPDTITTTTSEKSLAERAGRNVNGMTW